ncbi:UbiC transcription regulator-associated domain protein [Enterococcus canis]|uniref:UbiC transcription regulator-associated domain protein n=1 Tax=Enterococcus canis TaxID=214095 RepID=A0A1L8RCS8_9ENTE|nr:GntR family transcriptional regulator [Enterococcus canis]OJG17589.1 UbiC transcription regulator-associated domain protein [Enterococcus canis]
MERSQKQPLYTQLVDLMKEKIETEMAPNEILPSERELSERYGLSRTTVRLAMQELEKMGYIYRHHGKGTFVSDLSKQTTNLSGTYSFTEQMISMGKVPETKIIELESFEANKYLASQLNLSLGEPIFKLKRLRLADGQPMMVERSYLPVKKFMSLTKEQLTGKPLYDIFAQDFQERIRVADEEFFASIARSQDAELLDISEGAPVLNLIRTTYNIKNEIIEYTLSVARADQFRYRIRHVRED